MRDLGGSEARADPAMLQHSDQTLFSSPYNTVGKRPISYLDCIQQEEAQIPAGTSSECCGNTHPTLLLRGLITT